MVGDELLQKFLEGEAEKALKEIKEKGVITMDNAIPVMLHFQYNHILHLEQKMATKDDINLLKDEIKLGAKSTKEEIDSLAKSTKEEIRSLRNWMMFGISLITVFIALLAAFMR